VIYLIFNAGYTAASGDQLVRLDLCAEGIRLARVLNELLPDQSENIGLLALMLLHDSRRHARVLNDQLVTLDEQDRSLWDRAEITEGLALIEKAAPLGPAGPYLLQAAIASVHARAKSPQDTDWSQAARLYAALFEINPSPVIALNQAVAVAMSVGLDEGLRRIDALGESGKLDEYYLYHAARADILRRMGRPDEALSAYEAARALTTNAIEQSYLDRRIAEVKS